MICFETCLARFCSSPLWLRQSLPAGAFPAALQERDFIVPNDSIHCNDARRNFTDFQETSQWLGGVAVPKAILSNLCGAWAKKISPLCFPPQELYPRPSKKIQEKHYNNNNYNPKSGELKTGEAVVVVHPTSYDGALELAGLQLGLSVTGSSSVEAHHKCAQEMVKSHLLQEQGSKMFQEN